MPDQDNAHNQPPTGVKLQSLLLVSFGVLFMVVSLASVVLVQYQMRQQALAEAKSKARLLLDRNLAIHTYFTHQLKPSLFEWSEPFRAPDYFDPTWMSSTYAVREIDQYFKSMGAANYYYKEAAINARSPENEADPFEAEFIQKMNADPAIIEQTLIRELDGKPYFVTLRQGETMDESCLRCHSEPGQAPGGLIAEYGDDRSFHRQDQEVVSAISIRVPLDEAYGNAQQFGLQLSLLLLGLLLLLFLTQSWLISRFLFKPLSRVRQAALQITGSEEHLGEAIDLPATRELKQLTSAFNQMSAALRHSYDDLEQKVAERTAELKAANQQLENAVAERTRAFQALEESENRYRAYIEHAPIGVFIVDQDGRYIDVNQAACQMTGYTRQELLAMSIADLASPAENSPGIESFSLLKEHGKISTELLMRRKDGSDFYATLEAVALPDQRLMGFCADISQRVAAEQALKQSEQLLNFVIDQMPVPVVVAAPPDVTITRYNRAAADFLAKTPSPERDIPLESRREYWPTFHTDGSPYPVDQLPLTKAIQSGETTLNQEMIVRQGEHERWVSASAAPLIDQDGNVLAGILVFPEITHQKQVEAELQGYSEHLEVLVEERTRELSEAHQRLIRHEKLATLGQLASSISHELKNPLGVIKNAAYFLNMSLQPADPQDQQMLEILNQEVDRSEKIINDLLNFARSKPPNQRPTDLNQVIRSCVNRHQIPENITVIDQLEENQPEILADPDQLGQVFTNLVQNAVRAMPEGGFLTLSGETVSNEKGEPRIAIHLADTGVGIPPENLERIFEPLFTTRSQGIGLGLSIVKMIVEAHGGQLQVASQVGEGSTFTVLLPIIA